MSFIRAAQLCQHAAPVTATLSARIHGYFLWCDERGSMPVWTLDWAESKL